ncbi:hypothetical protein NDU88_003526 [Pleurodeles waltl]|uniref:Uncharacterized protein n=1 Tax=Pleurodeles waltl TaxID=8319 RepID=A0AAV7WT17_PLEWA|nr:hypothetical protein NDU88_003526 [Pleurodeles waltl]
MRGNNGVCFDFLGRTRRRRDGCASISSARLWILFGLRGFQTPRGRCVDFLRWLDEVTGAASIRWGLRLIFYHTAGAASKSACVIPAQLCVDPVGHAPNFRSLRWRCVDILIVKSGCVVPVWRAVKFAVQAVRCVWQAVRRISPPKVSFLQRLSLFGPETSGNRSNVSSVFILLSGFHIFIYLQQLLSQKVVGAWVSLLPAPPLTLLTEPSSTLNSIVYSLVLFRCPGNNQRKKLQGLLQPSTNPASSTTPCGDTPIHRYRTNTANTPEAQAQQTHLQPPLSQEYLQLEGPATQRPQREHGKDRGTRDIAQPPQSHIR